ncbi:SDR family oxidoreductase [Novosphingobium sp. ERN07]|uniref:SDR family NAD(P)-dependent oxidoreductase n=1 Tax=Novosphingobium sp. ERN07 TaxID=2726187 RepID=UPI0014566E04|nr:SDR family NAD(P)-dependent oxidoreductase [Novosphingobium sp. ERN07]NLR72997.1 SDR family oxidoreductase [Novosphingobium sp. ERN07]
MATKRSIIVTGGASGIGKACAELACERGWAVTLADRDPQGATVAETLRAAGGDVRFVETDVTSEDSVRALVRAALDACGQLHGAINSAGIVGSSKPIHEIDLAAWDRVHAVNMRGTFLCLKHEIAAMWDHRAGSVVCVSSAAAIKGLPWSSDYCGSKAGINGMVRSAAMDCAAQGIRVNALLPGPTITPLAMNSSNANPALAKVRIRPMERMAEPVEVARAAIWLVSDEASFVTGVSMPVDGGMVVA